MGKSKNETTTNPSGTRRLRSFFRRNVSRLLLPGVRSLTGHVDSVLRRPSPNFSVRVRGPPSPLAEVEHLYADPGGLGRPTVGRTEEQ